MIFETWAFTKECLPKNIWAVKNLIWYFIILKNSKCFEMKGGNAQKLVMLFASAQGCQSAKLAKMRNCCPWFQFVLLPLVNNLSIKKIIYITIQTRWCRQCYKHKGNGKKHDACWPRRFKTVKKKWLSRGFFSC